MNSTVVVRANTQAEPSLIIFAMTTQTAGIVV